MSKHPQPSVGAQTSDLRNGVLFFSGVLGKRAEPCLLEASVQGAAEVRAILNDSGRLRRRRTQVVNVNNGAVE